MGYIREYAYDMAYVPPLKEGETPLAVRKQMYVALDMIYRSRIGQDIQVVNKYPNLNWPRI
jgi:hypothetical protein